LQLRSSTESDRAAIEGIHRSAFGADEGEEIVELVNNLFEDETARPLLSLVAELHGKLVGHILFTALRIEPGNREVTARILAPLAVSSETQGEGVGAALIGEGLRRLQDAGVELVFVLGHPGYYPKFGFRTAGSLGLQAPHPIPAEHADAWMVRALKPGIIDGIEGTVQCSKILNQPRYWRE
jgi:predicted N-acetyltransferase YhbS